MVSIDDVRHISQLACLQFDDDELPVWADELSAVFAMVNVLRQADTSCVEPMRHVHHHSCPMRLDEAQPVTDRAQLAALALQVAAGLYVVPKVIDEGV